jgi:hypothetical protein
MWLPTLERNLLSVVTVARDVSAAHRSTAIVVKRSHKPRHPLSPAFSCGSRVPLQRDSSVGIHVAPEFRMLKLIGSFALAKLLGFGLLGAIVIYALLSLLT